jgi:hypothetical protein
VWASRGFLALAFVTKLFFQKEKSPLIKGGRGVVSKEIRGKK